MTSGSGRISGDFLRWTLSLRLSNSAAAHTSTTTAPPLDSHVPRLLQCASTSRKGIKRKICGSIMTGQGESRSFSGAISSRLRPNFLQPRSPRRGAVWCRTRSTSPFLTSVKSEIKPCSWRVLTILHNGNLCIHDRGRSPSMILGYNRVNGAHGPWVTGCKGHRRGRIATAASKPRHRALLPQCP